MNEMDVEKMMQRSLAVRGLSSFASIVVLLFLFSGHGHVPWVGMTLGALATVSISYSVYSRNVEAHYLLTKKLPGLYRKRLNEALQNHRIGTLLMKNWFVKLEEELRHQF